jgi:hypothetical protein
MGYWVFAVFLGNAWTAENDLRLQLQDPATDIRFADVAYDDQSAQSPIYYGARLGHGFAGIPWLAIETEFIHLKTIADEAGLAAPMPRFEMSHGLNLLFVNAAVRINPFVLRVGMGPTIPHVETSVRGDTVDGYQFGSFAVQAAGAIEVSVWKQLFATGEFKWTRTTEDLEVPGGHLEGTFATRHLVVGVGWRTAR